MKIYICDKCGEPLVESKGILVCLYCHTEYDDADGLSYEVVK